MSALTCAGCCFYLWIALVALTLFCPVRTVVQAWRANRSINSILTETLKEFAGKSYDAMQTFVDSERGRLATLGILREFKNMATEDMKNFLDSEWERAQALDENLRRWTLALPLMVTVGGLVWPAIFQISDASLTRCFVSGFFMSTIACFVVGSLISFKGSSPITRYGYGAEYLNLIAGGEEAARKAMLEALVGYECANLIRSNRNAAAVNLTRYGVVFFAVAIGASIVSLGAG